MYFTYAGTCMKNVLQTVVTERYLVNRWLYRWTALNFLHGLSQRYHRTTDDESRRTDTHTDKNKNNAQLWLMKLFQKCTTFSWIFTNCDNYPLLNRHLSTSWIASAAWQLPWRCCSTIMIYTRWYCGTTSAWIRAGVCREIIMAHRQILYIIQFSVFFLLTNRTLLSKQPSHKRKKNSNHNIHTYTTN